MALYSYANVGQLKVNNNKVMCQMSMKLLAMFDQNPPHTLDKTVKKLITIKKRSQSLTLTPNVKVIAEIKSQGPGEQKHATQKKFEQGVP